MEEYKIYRTNKFNDSLVQDIVAVFYDEDLARNFIDYQFTLGNYFAIFHNGERIEF